MPEHLPCPVVLFTHNVEAEIWRRHAETRSNPVARLLYRIQHAKMLRFEGATLRRFNGVLAVSDADRSTFYRLYPGAIQHEVHVVPTGVDTAFFDMPAGVSVRPGHLVFTGSMDWLPNEDAMLFFCRDILPRIRAQEPSASLAIIGREPTPAVRRLAEINGVAVTGRVDDVRRFLAEGDVYVVPLRIGGGTRLKIFEAMAMGKPIVSTAVGAEGLPVRDGEHLVLADDPARFADAVVRLLRDTTARRQLAEHGRDLVRARYDWSAVAGELDAALERFAFGAAGDARAVAISVTAEKAADGNGGAAAGDRGQADGTQTTGPWPGRVSAGTL
jgi:glycosyltransferase involved in cell wall biosynthesis